MTEGMAPDELLVDALPYLERQHAMTRGGPARSKLLGLIEKVRAAIKVNPRPAASGHQQEQKPMFTILWKTDQGGEEIYQAPSVSFIPAALVPSEQMDCSGRQHIAFQRLDGHDMVRSVIDVGDVFVMNANGKTVATYRFRS